jgi:hypothetical protein
MQYSMERPSSLERPDPLCILTLEEEAETRGTLFTIKRSGSDLIQRTVGHQGGMMDMGADLGVCGSDRSGRQWGACLDLRHSGW